MQLRFRRVFTRSDSWSPFTKARPIVHRYCSLPIRSSETVRQIYNGEFAFPDLSRQLRRWLLGDDQVFSPAEEVFETVGQQSADTRNCVQDVIAVGTIDPIHLNMRVIDANLPSLADQSFEN